MDASSRQPVPPEAVQPDAVTAASLTAPRMPTPPSVTLVQDVLLRIVELGCEDLGLACVLNLVTRSFGSLAKAALFRVVSANQNHDSGRQAYIRPVSKQRWRLGRPDRCRRRSASWAAVINFFSERPYLCCFVKELRLIGRSTADPQGEGHNTHTVSALPQLAATMFALFRHIHTLTLTDIKTVGLPLTDLPSGVLLLRFDGCIIHLGELPAFIGALQDVQSLVLGYRNKFVSFHGYSDADAPEFAPELPSLTNLTVMYNFFEPTEANHVFISCPGVRTLAMSLSPVQLWTLSASFQYICSRMELEEFHLRLCESLTFVDYTG